MDLNLLIFILVLIKSSILKANGQISVISTTQLSTEKDDILTCLQKRVEHLESQTAQILKSLEEQRNILKKIEKIYENRTNEYTQNLPKNCLEIKESGVRASGIYTIQPKFESFPVFCDMVTRGGGWTVIQNRFDGSQDFYLNWDDYKKGFGSLDNEFWLGFERIHQLTGHEYNELYIDLLTWQHEKAYAYYSSFYVGSEKEDYKLKFIDGYEGTGGDSLKHHIHMKVSTKDRDQDTWTGHCAADYGGGWWFRSCSFSNLNGKYLNSSLDGKANSYGRGLHWHTFTGIERSLMRAKMMVRPR